MRSGAPSYRTSPSWGTSPTSALSRELLPQPDSPTSARVSPGRTTSDTPSTAGSGAVARPHRASGFG